MPVRKLRAVIFIPGFVALVAVLGLVYGSTAANSIPPSRAGLSHHPATARQLAPPECAGMALTTVAWLDNGTLQGTNGNELLIGSENTTRINGRNGHDCLVIGSGNKNRLDGGAGNDVCIGNATTRFNNCEVEIIRGAAPAGSAQMELTPAVETAETSDIVRPEGLDESLEPTALDEASPGGEATPAAEPTNEPAAETDATPVSGMDLEGQ